jgi:predicted nucleic acid-binding protein
MMTKIAHPYLLDTSVIIGHLRGNLPDAERWVLRAHNDIPICISSVTEFELLVGAKTLENKRQYKIITARFRCYPLIKSIARRAAELVQPYVKSKTHHHATPDAMIGATAEYYHCDLVTANPKDFRVFNLQGIKIIPLKSR